jgi:hypothetical protein
VKPSYLLLLLLTIAALKIIISIIKYIEPIHHVFQKSGHCLISGLKIWIVGPSETLPLVHE